jgi:hypothetical protein
MKERIIKAWSDHYELVKNNLDSYGWYDGRNDKVQKTFEGLEITTSSFYKIPSILLKPEQAQEVIQEVIEEPIQEVIITENLPSKAKKKTKV